MLFLTLIGIVVDFAFSRLNPAQSDMAPAVATAVFLWSGVGCLLFNFRNQVFGRADAGGLGMMGALLGTAVALIAFGLAFQRNPNALWERAVPLGAATFLAAMLPATLLTHSWQTGLRRTRLRRHLPQLARPVWMGSIGMGIIIFLGLGFVTPLGGYVGLPIVIDRLFDRLEPPPLLSPRQTIIKVQREVKDYLARDDLPQESRAALTDFHTDLQNGLDQMPPDAVHLELLREIIKKLEEAGPTLPGALPFVAGTAVSELNTYEIQFTQQIPVQPDPGFQAPENIPWPLFIMWAVFVGAAAFVSTLLGMAAQSGFINRVNAQLPPPIFHSVAAMTRIVVWEAKQALEVRGVIMDYIQWTAVTRNELGGITLTGLHRDLPDLQTPDEAMRQRVPAQLYTIKSNQWADIVNANLLSTTAGHAPRVPNTDISRDFFAEIDQRSYEHIRP